MKIPIVVVDDDEIDRYLVKRKLSRCEDFDKLIEVDSGDEFLEAFYTGENATRSVAREPVLVLMDVNMPGRDGFQTAAEIQRRAADALGPDGIVIMMLTSSNNHRDKQRAEELEIIKGYIAKPLDSDDIDVIRGIYQAQQSG